MLIAALQFYAFDFEVHSNGADIVRLERFLAVPHQKARLGHSTAPYHQLLQGDTIWFII